MRKNNPFYFSYTAWLPANLDLDYMLRKNPITVSHHKNSPERIRDRLAYIIGSLSNSYYTQIEEGYISDENAYAPLHSTIMQSVIRDYNKYIDYAISMGIIEEGPSYFAGKYCNRYSFSKKYRNQDKKAYVILDETFVKTIYSKRQHSFAQKKYAKQFLVLEKLTVCWDTSNKILDRLYGKKDSRKRRSQEQRLMAVEDIRQATFKVGSTNRLYTTICNLHEELRGALRYKGLPLVCIDIKNSIPFVTTALFNKQAHNVLGIDISFLEDINPRLKFAGEQLQSVGEQLQSVGEQLQSVGEQMWGAGEQMWGAGEQMWGAGEQPLGAGEQMWGAGGHLLWLMLVDIANRIDKYPKVKRYMDEVKAGTIYELVWDEWNNHPDIKTKYNRDKTKKRLMEIFNSPSIFESTEKDVLKDLFPNVIKIVDSINTGYYKTKNGNGWMKWKPGDLQCPFANLTQRLEAKILLDIVCPAINQKHPDIPTLTLHDSIFTTKSNEEMVKQMMEQEYKKIFGYIPEMSITYY